MARELNKVRPCEHCGHEFEMHPGDNFCSECAKFTFVPAVETNGGQKL